VELPSYRGDIVNALEFSPDARRPDPERQIQAYAQAAATLNLLRAFTGGGYAALTRVHDWYLDFIGRSPQSERYRDMADRISEALAFMAACGVLGRDLAADRPDQALHLARGAAARLRGGHDADRLHRRRQLQHARGTWSGSGDRTRDPDGAHVEYVRGVANPIGLKAGPSMTVDDLLRCATSWTRQRAGPAHGDRAHGPRQGRREAAAPGARLAVGRQAGRVGLRPDARQHDLFELGPPEDAALRPDHGRDRDVLRRAPGRGHPPGRPARRDDGAKRHGCTGGTGAVTDDALSMRYRTHCDPRLNAEQSLEVAFLLAENLKAARQTRRTGA
jgi:3-deoxy-7-phosphoheptulonate synthase